MLLRIPRWNPTQREGAPVKRDPLAGQVRSLLSKASVSNTLDEAAGLLSAPATDSSAELASRLMLDFAARTGVNSTRSEQRYLWTGEIPRSFKKS